MKEDNNYEYEIFFEEENDEDKMADEICQQIEKKLKNKNMIIW